MAGRYVQIDWGVDQSTFCLAGHADRSHLIVLKKKSCSVFSVVISSVRSKSLCIAKLRSEIPGEMPLEPLFTIHFAAVMYFYC